MADYANTWFDAMSVLINKKIESIKFDQTVTAIVTDDSQAEKGIYKVTEDQVHTYQAYSTVTDYKNNDGVLVTIPCGDYENQKMIVGKAISSTDSPIIYTSPFSTIIDISNNLINRNLGEKEMWANGSSYRWPIEIKQFPGEDNPSNPADQQYGMTCIWDSKDSSASIVDAAGIPHLNLAGYTRLGLQTQVATYLDDYNTILGNYGLALEITFRNTSLPEGQNSFVKYITFDSDEYFGDVYSFDTYYTQEAVYDIGEYSRNDFSVDRIRLFMYQRHNFIDIDGWPVPAPEDEDDYVNIGPNIIFKDFYICVGTAAEGFNEDDIRLICNNNLDYYKHSEEISAADLHSDNNYLAIQTIMLYAISRINANPNIISFKEGAAEGASRLSILTDIAEGTDVGKVYKALQKIDHLNVPNKDMTLDELESYKNKYDVIDANVDMLKAGYPAFKVLSETLRRSIGRLEYNTKDVQAVWLHKDDTTGAIATVEENHVPLNYEIYWYRYLLGAPSPDMFAGPHWVRFYGCKPDPDINEDYCITVEDIAVALDEDPDNNIDIATNHIVVSFIPNVNNAEEKLKAIIVYNESYNQDGTPLVQRFVAKSEPIIFTNNDEVSNQATIIDLNALAIRIDDTSQGKYFLYNRSDSLDEDFANRIRSLTAVFDLEEPDVNKKAVLSEYSSIKWTFPSTNSMIIPATSPEEDGVPAQQQIFTNCVSVGYLIDKQLNRYATNNTVQLEVVVDGVNYEADVTLFFGTAGTSGSDYTVVLNWKNVNSALDVTYPGWDSLKGEVALQDRNGQYIDIPTDATVEYDWLIGDMIYDEDSPNYEFELEDRDLYYPVFPNNQEAIFDPVCTATGSFFTEDTRKFRQSDEATYGGYYYYLDESYEDTSKALSQLLGRGVSYNVTLEGFEYSNNYTAIPSYETSLAYFDLENEEYKKIDSSVQVNPTTHMLQTADKINIGQLYRKRKNELNLTKTQTINKDEHFFKIIYDIFYPNQDVYNKFFNGIDGDVGYYWPVIDENHYLIQNQDNMINTKTSVFNDEPEVSNHLISITDYFIKELNEDNVSNEKDVLEDWISDFRQRSIVFYNNAQEVRIQENFNLEEELLELIFNIKNIYEYMLNKLKSNISSLSSLNSLPYYYYSTSTKQFIQISNTTYLSADNILNSVEEFIFGDETLYNLEGFEDIDGKIYEFSKPKIEFVPLSLISDMTTIENQIEANHYQNDLHSAIFEGSNSAILSRDDSSFDNFYKEFYYVLYQQEYNGAGTAKQELDTLINDYIARYDNDAFGYTSKNAGCVAFQRRTYWKNKTQYSNDFLTILDYFYQQLNLITNGRTNDYIAVSELSNNTTEANINNFYSKFYQEFVLKQVSTGLASFFNRAGQSVNLNADNTNLIYTTLNNLGTNFSKEYIPIYDILSSYNIETDGVTNYLTSNFYSEVLVPIINNINNFYLLSDNATGWEKAIYAYLAHKPVDSIDLVDSSYASEPTIDIILNYYFQTVDNAKVLKLKLIEDLPSGNSIWVDKNRNSLFSQIRSGTNLVKFYNKYITKTATEGDYVQSLTHLGDENRADFVTQLDKFIRALFTYQNSVVVENRIKGIFLETLLSKTTAIDQHNSYEQLIPITQERVNELVTDLEDSLADELENLYYNSGSSDAQCEKILFFINRYINSAYNFTNMPTPIASTLSIYKHIYNVISNTNCFQLDSGTSSSAFFENLNYLLFKNETHNDNALINKIFDEMMYDQDITVPILRYGVSGSPAVGRFTVYEGDTPNTNVSYGLWSDNHIITGHNGYPVYTSQLSGGAESALEDYDTYYIITSMKFVYENEDEEEVEIANLGGTYYGIHTKLYSNITKIVYALSTREKNNNGNWVSGASISCFRDYTGESSFKLIDLINAGTLKIINDGYKTVTKQNIIQWASGIDLTAEPFNNKDVRYAILFWLRCLNKFMHRNDVYTLDFSGLLSDGKLMLIQQSENIIKIGSSNYSSYYYYNIGSDIEYYNKPYVSNEELATVSNNLLNKHIYNNGNALGTSGEGYKQYLLSKMNLTDKSFYTGTPCNAYENLELLFNTFMNSNNLNITLIEKYEEMLKNEELLWKYVNVRQDNSNFILDVFDYDNKNEVSDDDNDYNFNQYLLSDTLLTTGDNGNNGIIDKYFYQQFNSSLNRVREAYPISGGMTQESENKQKESQLNYFKELVFDCLSSFYFNLDGNVNVIKQIANDDYETFNLFKLDFYNFISNAAALTEYSSDVDQGLAAYFGAKTNAREPIQYLFSLIPDNENAEYQSNMDNFVGVDTEEKFLYNIKYEIQNISTQAWLYTALTNLSDPSQFQIQQNVNDTAKHFSTIRKLQSLGSSNSTEDQIRIELQNILKGYLTNTADEVTSDPADFIRKVFDINSEIEGSTGTALYYLQFIVGNPRTLIPQYNMNDGHNFEYKIIYSSRLCKLYEIFKTDVNSDVINDIYITAQKLIQKYNNIILKNTVYKNVSDNVSTIGETENKVFNYYNRLKKKAFINVNGYYILDPYDNWMNEATYYEPLQVKQYKSKVHPLRYTARALRENGPNVLVEVYPKINIPAEQLMNSLSILRVTISNFGDYNLVACFPIALRNGTKTSEYGQITFEAKYLNGATEVRYSTMGTTDYNKNPYRLFTRTYDVENGIQLFEQPDNESNNANPELNNWQILIPSKALYNYDTGNFVPTLSNRLLKPSPVYIPNLEGYGVQYVQYPDDDDRRIILWTQPIWSYEDNYPSSTLNAWNGKDIQTDNETGTIVASALAAGKKERDNTFTGVMIGDWSRTDTDVAITKQTGLYGFYHGSMSYAFKDDGTGFIGKDGRGRIYFDGTNSTIYSSNWIGNEPLGMLLDIDDGIIQLQSKDFSRPTDDQDEISLDRSYNEYSRQITVQDTEHVVTVEELDISETLDAVTGQKYHYISLNAQELTYPLSIGYQKAPGLRNFRVRWDGTTYITNGIFSGLLHAKGGILDNNFIVNGSIYGGNFVGGDIYVRNITANQGWIGAWKITKQGLVNADGSTYLVGATANMNVVDEATGETIEIDSPTATSIITNRILIKTNNKALLGENNSIDDIESLGITGALGYIEGKAIDLTQASRPTYTTGGIGLVSTEKVIFRSTEKEAALRSATQTYIEGGYSDGSAWSAQIQVGGAPTADGSVSGGTATVGTNAIFFRGTGLWTNIPAENQWGFYARFA